MLNNYCWMYSTFSNNSYHTGPCAGVPGPTSQEYVYNTYYQWIPFFLVTSAAIFAAPSVLWKQLDGGFFLSLLQDTSTEENLAEVKYSFGWCYYLTTMPVTNVK